MSSLSNEALQTQLRKHFVPVWVSRDQYQLEARSTAEHKELLRIDRAAKEAKLPGGAVAVFVIAPDGKVIASQNLHEAIDPKKLLPLLEDVVAKNKFPARTEEAIKATTAPLRPLYRKTDPDSAIFHVLARFDERRKHYGVSEDWVEIRAADWKQMLPSDKAVRGDTWDVPQEVVDKLARHFYPPGPNWRLQDSEVKKAQLTGRLSARSDKFIVVHLSGTFEVGHPFGKNAPGTTTATMAGVLHYDRTANKLVTFELASTEAVYAWMWRDRPQPEKISLGVELEP